MVIDTAKKMLPAISPEVFELPSSKGVRVCVSSTKVISNHGKRDALPHLMMPTKSPKVTALVQWQTRVQLGSNDGE